MPVYEYQCERCQHTFEQLLKIAEMKKPLEEACVCCGEKAVVQNPTLFSQGDPVRFGHKRPDAGWNEVLSRVKQSHPKGNFDSRFGSTGVV